jgi:DNA-binding transcriptional MerR regulator
MAQLNLRLPEGDIAAIRAQASARGLSVSELLRRLALGEQPSTDALAQLRSDLASLTRRLDGCEAQIAQISERDPCEQLEALDRRLGRIEEIAAQGS